MPLSADSKMDQTSERRQRFQVARCDAPLTGAIHCTVLAAPDDFSKAADRLTTIDRSAGLKRTASKPPRRRSS